MKNKSIYITLDGKEFYDEKLAEKHEKELIKVDPLYNLIKKEGNRFYDSEDGSDWSDDIYCFINENRKILKSIL